MSVGGRKALAGATDVSYLCLRLKPHACLIVLQKPWPDISVTMILKPCACLFHESSHSSQAPENVPCIDLFNDAWTPRSSMADIRTRLPAVRHMTLRYCSRSVLCAYSRGIVSSRQLEQAGREHMTFMALSCGRVPDPTTIAACVSSMQEEMVALFRDVLLVCEKQGWFGGTHVALDGLKRSSHAAKEWSGTCDDLGQKTEPWKGNGPEYTGGAH